MGLFDSIFGGGGSSGGGADAMLQYGDKALALQKQIYEDTVKRSEPFYNAGVGGINELMMRLGLGNGSATGSKTADQFRSDFLPNYTTTNTVTDPTGGPPVALQRSYTGAQTSQNNNEPYYMPTSAPQTTTSIDEAGLKAAIDKAMADQTASGSAASANPLYGSLLKSYSGENLKDDPSYQFRMDEGNKAVSRQLAASHKYLTPSGSKALMDYGQNTASTEYGNAYNRFNNDQGNIFNRLAAISGIGQTANGQTAAAGSNYANSASDIYTGQGNAITASNIANQSNKGSMFNTLLGAGIGIGGAAPGSFLGKLFS